MNFNPSLSGTTMPTGCDLSDLHPAVRPRRSLKLTLPKQGAAMLAVAAFFIAAIGSSG
jgi:hypothetical protein